MTTPDAPRRLPDVADDAAAAARPLDWVGMANIALPVRIGGRGRRADPGRGLGRCRRSTWRDADARGIHMSRLYLQLQEAFAGEAVTPAGLRRVLQGCVDSQEGLSSAARLVLRYDQMLLRPALASDNAGWKRYPVEIDARCWTATCSWRCGSRSITPAPARPRRRCRGSSTPSASPRISPRAHPLSPRSWATGWHPSAAWPPRPHAQRSRAESASSCGRSSRSCRWWA